MKRQILLAMAALFRSAEALAITVDGTRDVEYGSAVAVQGMQTGFGDVITLDILGGSELDAAYAKFSDGRLYLMFTGNHEPNFNKLDVFIDSAAGGENRLSSTPEYDFNNGGNWISKNLGGMRFDNGFTADYHLFSRWGGNSTPEPYEVDFVNRQGGTSAMVPGASEKLADPVVNLVSSGFIAAGDVGPNASASSLTQNLEYAINDSNTSGVSGGNGVADQDAALAVTTGMEFSIALADIGSPTPGSQIKIVAVINNGDHNYLSNQILGSLQPNPTEQGNLGGDGTGGFTGSLGALRGDYNHDFLVDAADYTVWRDNFGTTASLPNDETPGVVDGEDYDAWKTNFGRPAGIDLNFFPGEQFFTLTVPGPGLAAGQGVPEPTSIVGGFLGLLFGSARLRRRRT
jgi:hypothetical protein